MWWTNMHLDEASELLEQRQGVVGHGVDLGAVPIPGLAAAGGGTHLGPTAVVGQGFMDVAARA